MMERFYENGKRQKAIIIFCNKVASQMFDRVLVTSLSCNMPLKDNIFYLYIISLSDLEEILQ